MADWPWGQTCAAAAAPPDSIVLRAMSATARAGNRQFWRLSAPRAHTKAPYKPDLRRETRRAPNRPGRARTGDALHLLADERLGVLHALRVARAARAGNRRFWWLSALRARTKAPYKTELHRKTLMALNRPRWPGQVDERVGAVLRRVVVLLQLDSGPRLRLRAPAPTALIWPCS
jgi:hypothetical protein